MVSQFEWSEHTLLDQVSMLATVDVNLVYIPAPLAPIKVMLGFI